MRRQTAANLRARRAPCLEPLERRHLMAAWSPVGPETLVNDTTTGTEQTTFASHKSIAGDDNGRYVVVWSGNGPGDADGIYARRYDASGPLGPSFKVNSFVTGVQTEAAVAMDNSGNFIVVWSSNGQDGSGWGVYGQRYNAAGVAQGAAFLVNVTTAGNQNQPSVAADATGNFVVTWTSENIDGAGEGLGIAAHRYNAAGVAQGGEIHVNTYTGGDQVYSRVAMDDAGNFTVVWQSDYLPTSSIGIFGQRYTAAGAASGLWFVVNTTVTGLQRVPAIGMNAAGAFVVAWTSDGQDGSGRGIYAQRYNNTGAKVGAEFAVNTTTAGDQQYPSVVVDDTGSYAIAWESAGQDSGSSWGVYARQYSSAGASVGGEFRINTTTNNDQQSVALAMVGNGDAVAVWSGRGAGDNDGVFLQRLVDAPGINVTPTTGLTTTESAGTASFSVVLSSAPTANVTIALSSTDTTEGSIALASLTFTPANWNTPQLVTITGVDDAVADGTIAYSIVTATAVSTDPEYSGRNPADVAVIGLDDLVEPPAIGTEFRVNTTVADVQDRPAVAMTSFGSFVAVWSSRNQDGGGKGIYAQRYGVGGVPLGTEFLVNQFTAGDQDQASVAVDAYGNFVVTWMSKTQDGSGNGVYARRFAADGTPLGNEFLVNTTTTDNQDNPTVAVAPDGSFVIAWRSSKQDGSGGGIFAQRFAANGARAGGEFQVNTNVVDNQDQPSAAINGAGGFVITWKSNKTDGSGAGVFARRYAADGTALGPDFRVNTTASANQDKPTIAMNRAGTFVIAWASQNQDGDRKGVFAQRFNASGAPVGGEFLVNTITFDDQDRPALGMSDSGGFAIAWASKGQDGDGKAIWVRHYDASGNPLGSAPVNTTTALNQDDPALGMDASGDFIVLWSGNGVGDAAGVFGRRYASPEVVVLPASGTTTTESGGAVTFGIVLNTAPSANVVISLVSSDATEGTVSLGSITFTPANWNVVRTITVIGVGDALNDGDIAYSVIIGAATSSDPAYSGLDAADVSLVNIDTTPPPPNSPPTVVTTNAALQYFENAGAVAVDAGVTVSDSDDAFLSGATASISGYVFGQDVLAFTGAGAISAAWNAATGTLTLSGNATVAQYQAALRAVTYTNNSDNPTVAGRSVRFVVSDGKANSTPAVRSITVNAVDDAPVAAPESYITDADAPLSVAAAAGVLANDTDVDGGVLTAALTQQAANGTVQLFGDGSFSYTPNAGFVGPDQFVYRVSDGAGGSASATVTIQVTLNPPPGITVNPTSGLTTSELGEADSFTVVLTRRPTAPVRVDLSPSVVGEGSLSATSLVFDSSNWNVPQTVTVTGVDDGVVDGDRSYQIRTAPAISADRLYNGLDAADVAVTNLANQPPPPPVPPATGADAYSVMAGNVLTVAPAGVLSNDTSSTGQPMTAAIVQLPTHGVLSLATNGGFVYTPKVGYGGVDHFTYRASDANGPSAPTNVTITVTAPADPGSGEPAIIPAPVPPPPPPFQGIPIDEMPPTAHQEEAHEPSQPAVAHAEPPHASDAGPKVMPGKPAGATAVAPFSRATSLPVTRTTIDRRSESRRDRGEGDEPEIYKPIPIPPVKPDPTPAGPMAGPVLTAVGPLAIKIDAMAKQIANGSTAHNATIRSVSQVALAMTAGYVMWSLRGASLLASLVTSLPLWRSLDPLPILEARADKAAMAAKKRRRKKARRNEPEGDDEEKLKTFVS